MYLIEYIREQGIKKDWLAKQLGIKPSWLSVIIAGKHRMSKERYEILKKLTKGKVQYDEVSEYEYVRRRKS